MKEPRDPLSLEPGDARDPGRLLITHRAPDALLDRALLASPRAHRTGWTRAALTAVALLATGATLGWSTRGMVEVEHAPSSPPGAAPLRPAEVQVHSAATDGRRPPAAAPVRLVLHAPGAGTVSVAGTFNGWDPEATPLIHGADDVFYVIVPLERGRYEYMFVIDGERWVPDPAAPLSRPDDFGNRNGVLDV